MTGVHASSPGKDPDPTGRGHVCLGSVFGMGTPFPPQLSGWSHNANDIKHIHGKPGLNMCPQGIHVSQGVPKTRQNGVCVPLWTKQQEAGA